MSKQTKPLTTLQQLQAAHLQAWRNYRIGWAPGKKNKEYDLMTEAGLLVEGEIANVLARAKAAGLHYQVAYAYNPNQGANSNGKYHLLLVDDNAVVGKLQRKKGDALCKPRAKFWGLELRDTSPNCTKCLEIVEAQLARKTAAGNE